MTMRVSLIIDGDPKGAKAALASTEADLRKLGNAAGETQNKLNNLKPPKQPVEEFGRAVNLSARDLTNMQFQLQDMAVGLTSGQSPFTVMMQQGSQLSQMFKSGTGVMGALKAVGGGIVSFITNPLNLAVLGFGLASTAALSLFNVISSSNGNSILEKQAELVKRIGEEWDTSTGKIKKYSIESRNTLLFEAIAASSKLAEAAAAERSSLAVSGGKNTGGYRIAGVGQTELFANGNAELKAAADSFFNAVKNGKGDVMAFREEISRIGQSGADAATRRLVAVMLEQTSVAAEKYQADRRNNDLIKGLTGNTTLLNDVLGKSASGVSTLTEKVLALSAGAAARLGNSFGPARTDPSSRGSLLMTDPNFNGSVLGMGAAPQELKAWIFEAAEANRIDADLLARLINAESAFNPKATSAVGAMGLTQLMPGTARDLGVRNPYDAKDSIFGGAKYLSQLMRQFSGNEELSLMAYNWGQGNVRKWQRNGADPSQVPDETRNYVGKISSGSSLAKFDRKDDAKAIKEAEEAQKRANSQTERWAQLIAESRNELLTRNEAVGKSTYEQARLNKEQDLWAKARGIYGEGLEKDRKLHQALTAEIAKQADAYGKLAEQQMVATKMKAGAEVIERQQIERWDQIRQIGSGITSTLFQSIEAGQSWGSAFGSVLDSIKRKGLDLLDTVINNLLFGEQGTNGGGMLGGLTSGIGDFLGGLMNPASGGLYAQGAAFAGGAQMFANGSAFTNQIFTKPTNFTFGRGQLGQMAEERPEAVMPLTNGMMVRARSGRGETALPLTRMSDGSLGVDAGKRFARGDAFGAASSSPSIGGSDAPRINFQVHNYTGEKVEKTTRQNADGSVDIEAMIGKSVNAHIARGGSDDVMAGRFGVKTKRQSYG